MNANSEPTIYLFFKGNCLEAMTHYAKTLGGSIHDALARDAKSVGMPPGETFWAKRFAMFNDRYGTPWMLMYEGNKRPA